MTAALGNAASLAARAGGTVVRQVRSVLDPSSVPGPGAPRAPRSGWLLVTVNREPAEVDIEDRLPAPLAEFGDRIELLKRQAADAKGTEIGARFRTPTGNGNPVARLTGTDPAGDLRAALRRAKQLIEVGEVLRVDPEPHGKRSANPAGLLLEAWTRTAGRGGVR
jgi:hypothetical protein